MAIQKGGAPPTKWDPEANWKYECVLTGRCDQKHSPAKCAQFRKLSPEARLAEVQRKELCVHCFRHVDRKECWSRGKIPNCHINGCNQEHHPLLHDLSLIHI